MDSVAYFQQWMSKIQSNYQDAMARDPFGPPGSLRFWLHDHFLILVTLMAVNFRAGLWAWLSKMVASIVGCLICSPENPGDYQNMTETETMRITEYFEPDGWKKACRLSRCDPNGCMAPLMALGKLVVFHLWQPVSYVAIFFVYAPVLAKTEWRLSVAAWSALLREVLYAVSALITLCSSPAFFLYNLKYASWQDKIAYILCPEQIMMTSFKYHYPTTFFDHVYENTNAHDGPTWVSWLTMWLDILSLMGLVIGLNANVLERPVVVVWSLTATSGIIMLPPNMEKICHQICTFFFSLLLIAMYVSAMFYLFHWWWWAQNGSDIQFPHDRTAESSEILVLHICAGKMKRKNCSIYKCSPLSPE